MKSAPRPEEVELHHLDASPALEMQYSEIVASWSPEERLAKEKKFLRKIDTRMLPILILMYIMNYIDRNALPAARVQSLEKDLGLVGVEYNVVISLLFIGYISMQVPSNILLGLLRPSIYLPCCMIVWGIISGCAGAVQNFHGVAAVRFFLGIAEAPFFAGVAFLFSGWYTRKELGMRLGIFFCGAMLSGAFGGLFAAGIAAAFKNNRIESWRWLFIIEGAATVVFALATSYIIPDWPSNTKWLSHEERAIGVVRLLEDAGEEEEEITTKAAFGMAVKDYRVWLCIVGQFCVQAVASLTNFLPTLVRQLGYTPVNTLLLSAPPYLLTAVFCGFNAWYSDRFSRRSIHIIIPAVIAAIGIIITLATTKVAPRYFALFLMLPGTYGCFQISNAWMSNIASRPQKKRAISLALNNSLGNLALVWTPYLYPATAGPRYTIAWSVNLTLITILIGSTVLLHFCLKRDNKKMDLVEAAAASENVEFMKGEAAEHIERHGEHVTVGRRLGGTKAGVTARYDT